ncbi:MAG TPA: ABC transporter ATP-binding protein [Anaerolineales bacterium]
MTAVFPNQKRDTAGDFVVDAQGLTKQFGSEYAVRDLTFQIPKGKIIGLIGPSGSGKTTTVRLLMGIYTPTAGKVAVLGASPKYFTSQLRERMGYMPQHFALYPDLSVMENMNFAASLYGLGLLSRRKRLSNLLEFVELSKDRYKLARDISGGMKRRLSLAATLVHNPELVFLDEPTAGIDPILRRKFWDHFQELKKDGHTLFITTQYVNEAAYCDLVGVMVEGRLLILQTPERLRRGAFGGDVLDLKTNNPVDWNLISQISKLPFVRGKPRNTSENMLRIVVDDASTALPALLNWLNEQKVQVASLEEYLPPFDDVFVQIVEQAQAREKSGETDSGLVGDEQGRGDGQAQNEERQ